MKKSSKIVLELQRGDVLPLADARGVRVACLEGTLWITQEGDPHDIVVQSGEAHEVARDGRTVIQALDAGRAVVEAACSAAGSSGTDRPLRMLLPRAGQA
jgi:hypothetical protein